MIFVENNKNVKSACAWRLPLFALGMAGVLSACGGDDDDDNNPPEVSMGSVRVVHASADAPPVNIKLNGAVAIQGLDYAKSSGYADLVEGDYDIAVEGILPGDSTVEVISVEDFEVSEGSMTTILAINSVAEISPYVIDDSMTTMPAADEVALRVLHAAPDVPEVDVYLTAPDASLESASPAFSFGFGEDVDAGAVAGGDYQIRVTLAGTKTVAYDSGSVDLSGFVGESLIIAAIPVTNATQLDASPVQLLVVDDSSALTLQDASTQVGARVVHLSADAGSAANGPVEVFASNDALGADAVELIDAFSYTDIIPSAESHTYVPAGSYVFDVAPNTNMIGDSVFTSGALDLVAGAEYTVIASGLVTSTPAFNLLVSGDNQRSIATQAAVKVIHGSTAAGEVDVYVTAAGTVSQDAILAGDVEPLLSDFAFGDITDYVAVAPGDYDIRVVAGNAVAINIEGFTLGEGLVATVIARDPLMPEGEPSDVGVVVLTN